MAIQLPSAALLHSGTAAAPSLLQPAAAAAAVQCRLQWLHRW